VGHPPPKRPMYFDPLGLLELRVLRERIFRGVLAM
jgi:hypothetical protein